MEPDVLSSGRTMPRLNDRMNKYDPRKHWRHSIRLKGYDYTTAGAYFVTICVYRGRTLLGDIMDREMFLNKYGRIVEEEWKRTADLRPHVELDSFVVMPNHFHCVVWLTNDDIDTSDTTGRGMMHHAPTTEREFGKPVARSLSAVIGAFKAAVSRRVNRQPDPPTGPFWQRNFYEHIIRNQRSLDAIRQYIHDNPAVWRDDSLHPAAPPNKFNQSWDRGSVR
jgi:REP element-mobilizing transposase RayT